MTDTSAAPWVFHRVAVGMAERSHLIGQWPGKDRRVSEKLKRFELRHITGEWCLLWKDADGTIVIARTYTDKTRKGAIHLASHYCAAWGSTEPCSLRVRRMDGAWSKIERTYPRSADPKRSKG